MALSVSTWEARLLHSEGRIELHSNVRDWVTQATVRMREAPLTHEIVVVAQELPLPCQDPANRFLAATAAVLGLTLVTADHRLLDLGAIATLANR
jgi:PIN domain nuclease of toxin-antitoxin system